MAILYTSTGEYITRKDETGHKYPIVMLAGKEHRLTVPEMILWTKGMWNICSQDRLEELFKHEEEILGNMDFNSTLNRLLQRGLILSGEAGTDIGALHALIDKLVVKAADVSVLSQIKRFFIIVFKMNVSVRHAKTVFQKYDLTPKERMVLDLAKDTDITASELMAELNIKDTAALMLLSNLYSRKLVRFTEHRSGTPL